MHSDGHRATPVRRSLLEPQLIAGVERQFAILNLTLAGIFVLDLRAYFYLVIAAGTHWVLRRITKSDPYTRQCYVKYNLQGDRYDPWPRANPRRGRRPDGLGRGLTC